MRRAYGYLLILGLSILFVVAPASETSAQTEEKHTTTNQETASEVVQKTCPVMKEKEIDPKIFIEYEGKKVYFCCPGCRAAFLKTPEKYLDRLPQFSGSAHAAGEHTHVSSAGGSEKTSRENILLILVKPFGIATLTLLVLTACAGYFMRKNPKVLHKWHRRLACTTVVVAISHAVLVLLTH